MVCISAIPLINCVWIALMLVSKNQILALNCLEVIEKKLNVYFNNNLKTINERTTYKYYDKNNDLIQYR